MNVRKFQGSHKVGHPIIKEQTIQDPKYTFGYAHWLPKLEWANILQVKIETRDLCASLNIYTPK